ncbi:hypothetical protein M407DRAFT_246922 [Tulasnella calospora MUT 4182]|uniref:Secreted protein n=1 Tax=Tulasnella calospora MUT 4182 TaxID=1051891 RepID=A0A0C3PQD7_9AGAM|nr:hypothetical protein M407DRAFT_246922 [Tulasnella calospora MUT 4182]
MMMGRWGLFLFRRSFVFPLPHLVHERFSLVERASTQPFKRERGVDSRGCSCVALRQREEGFVIRVDYLSLHL